MVTLTGSRSSAAARGAARQPAWYGAAQQRPGAAQRAAASLLAAYDVRSLRYDFYGLLCRLKVGVRRKRHNPASGIRPLGII